MYFHPMLALAIERDRSYLVHFTGGSKRVQWFDRREDYLAMAEAVAVNPRLIHAMSAEMYEAFCAEEETEEAAACEARAEAWWDDLAHERVYAHVWPTGVF